MKTSALLFAAGIAAILPWNATAQTNLNRTPSRVLGHPSLSVRSTNPNVADGRSMFSPWAVVVDTSSTPNAVFVSDTANNRVLGWRDAVTFQNGARADLILGQLDEQSTERLGPNGNAARSLGFTLPGALAIDSKGSLYIVDSGNNRILRFPKPFASDAESRLPDLVIGQSNYTSGAANAGGVSETSLSISSGSDVQSSGLAFDPQGNLWFSDSLNHRVLRYPKAALDAGTNRPAANLVLGQPDFRANARPSGNVRLNKTVLTNPSGVTVDSAGRVYVADGNARVLVYTPPFTNGKEASRIVGVRIQPPNTPIAYEYILLGPEGVAILNNRLVVFDTVASRILRYDPFTDWPAESEDLPSPPAREVLGQAEFSGDRPNRQLPEPNASTVSRPVGGFAVGNDLYVADSGNSRVLVFPSFGPSAAATRVLGQLDFRHNSVNIIEGRELWTFNGFSTIPGSGVALADGGGVVVDNGPSHPPRLYISDSYNNRVLGYKDARRVRPNDPADIVIGQNDLTRSLVNAPQGDAEVSTDSGLFRPTGLAVDSNGDLFVADTGNGRVLRFPSPFDQTVGSGERHRANLVIGQRNFNEKFTDASRINMAAPFGVALTVERHLVVSDLAHNRVLFFRRPAGGDFTNGMAAERVLGQPDFTSTARVTADNRMFSPRHIALDTDDRLYVADAGNNRVLIFNNVPTSPNDPQAAPPITNQPGVQSIWVSPATGEIWVAATRSNEARRFPRFERLTLGIVSDYTIPVANPLALAQDSFGNLYISEATNRVSVFYNGLATQIAGNYARKPLSPGGIGIAYPQTEGSTFTGETQIAGSAPLPTELADIEVLLNDRPMPLYFVAPGQINFLVPFDMPESGSAELQVIRKSLGQVLGASTVTMARVSPGLFTLDVSNPAGQLAAVNFPSGTINGPANPIARGQYISLYGTGLGPVNSPPAPGAPASGEIRGVESIRVLIGDKEFVPAENIQFFGLAPGFAGLYQLNVKIPDSVAPKNDVDVVVEVRSTPSNRSGTPERIIRTTIAVSP